MRENNRVKEEKVVEQLASRNNSKYSVDSGESSGQTEHGERQVKYKLGALLVSTQQEINHLYAEPHHVVCFIQF